MAFSQYRNIHYLPIIVDFSREEQCTNDVINRVNEHMTKEQQSCLRCYAIPSAIWSSKYQLCYECQNELHLNDDT